MAENKVNRLKIAELTSGIGAVILGVGLGAHFSNWFAGQSVLILVIGIIMHAWGMFDKNRLEKQADASIPSWSKALYIVCWVCLLLLGVYIVINRGA